MSLTIIIIQIASGGERRLKMHLRTFSIYAKDRPINRGVKIPNPFCEAPQNLLLVKICTHINIFSTLMIQLGLDLKYFFVHCVGKAYVESFVVEIINICGPAPPCQESTSHHVQCQFSSVFPCSGQRRLWFDLNGGLPSYKWFSGCEIIRLR